MITIEIDDAQVRAVLDRLARRAANPRPALLEIGEELTESTLKRFASSTAPDGARWAPNAPSTLARWRGKGGKQPLIGEGKALSTRINYNVSGNTLTVGSPMIYAAAQQFGAKRGAFGSNKRGSPIPWGDIPARPFLGLSADDRKIIERIIRDHLDVG
jgi:phage virion morphogenesis protein